jgi:acyl dehydratase
VKSTERQGFETTVVARDLAATPFISDWVDVRQTELDVFSAVTGDWDYMHNDPNWAAVHGPWNVTIAHGFFVLALTERFLCEAGLGMIETAAGHLVEVGFDRVRFTEPVLVGDRVRGLVTLLAVEPQGSDQALVTSEVVVQTARLRSRPHLIATRSALWIPREDVREPGPEHGPTR